MAVAVAARWRPGGVAAAAGRGVVVLAVAVVAVGRVAAESLTPRQVLLQVGPGPGATDSEAAGFL